MPRCRQSPPSRIEKPFCLSALTVVPRLRCPRCPYPSRTRYRVFRSAVLPLSAHRNNHSLLPEAPRELYQQVFFVLPVKLLNMIEYFSLSIVKASCLIQSHRCPGNQNTARIAPHKRCSTDDSQHLFVGFLLAALQIRAAQATQTAAAISAMPSVSHNHDNSLIQFITSPVFSILFRMRLVH